MIDSMTGLDSSDSSKNRQYDITKPPMNSVLQPGLDVDAPIGSSNVPPGGRVLPGYSPTGAQKVVCEESDRGPSTYSKVNSKIGL